MQIVAVKEHINIDLINTILITAVNTPVTPARPVGHVLPQQPSRPTGTATAKPKPHHTSKC